MDAVGAIAGAVLGGANPLSWLNGPIGAVSFCAVIRWPHALPPNCPHSLLALRSRHKQFGPQQLWTDQEPPIARSHLGLAEHRYGVAMTLTDEELEEAWKAQWISASEAEKAEARKRREEEREQERLKGEEWFAEQMAEAWRYVELGCRIQEMRLAPDQEKVLYSLLTLPQEALGLLREHLGLPKRV